MKKVYFTLLAVLVCLGFFGAALGSVYNDALTSDEVSHIPAGYYYLTEGRFFINPEHPPLTKDLAALPLLFLKPTKPEITGGIHEPAREEPAYPYGKDIEFLKNSEINNGQWEWGRIFLFHPDNDPDKMALWARISVIFFNALFLFLLFLTLKRVWNRKSALIAIILMAVSPFMLAHASLVTLDFMPSLFMVIGFSWFAMYMKNWMADKKRSWAMVLAIIFFSMAMLSKFSFALVLPTAFIAGAIYLMAFKGFWKNLFKFILRFIVIAFFIGIIITLFYAPHVMNMPADEMLQQISNNYPEEAPQIAKTFLDTLAGTDNAGLKGVSEYLVGVVMVGTRIAGAWQTIYFLGGVYGSEGAGLLYFPLLFLTKMPTSFILGLLLLAGMIVRSWFQVKMSLKERLKNWFANPLSLFLIVLIFIYGIITLLSSFQIGLRHIMPIIMAAILLAARGTDKFWNFKLVKNFQAKYIFYILGAGLLVSVIWSFPNYLEYYNIFGGGTTNGYKIATDSNYDWGGQDVKRLAEWMDENGVEEIYTDIFSNVPLKYYLGAGQKNFNIEENKRPPSGAIVAVSYNEYQNNVFDDAVSANKKYSIWQDDLKEVVGKTILIFEVP
ncbi:glycosyltransferase family 39 protein [Patescibacteria group bacterium]|nr:glycosyltransferase family 39 protein [Patescibacteria group bacterium]MBU1673020.1 glycosyltransferase family 39 protein [Patescibacteria group bacterium]MBU1963289.1 glycosyltransferase family 39 protein [Patescibacteria group bacterium]